MSEIQEPNGGSGGLADAGGVQADTDKATTASSHIKRILVDLSVSALFLLGMALSVTNALRRYGYHPDNPERLGRLFGSAGGPLLVAAMGVYIYNHFRKRERTWRSNAIKIGIWTFVIALLGVVGRVADHERPPILDVAQLIREAGDPTQATDGKGGVYSELTRSLFRELIERNRQYIAEAQRFQTPEMAALYTAGSFRDKDSMRETVKQLKEMARFELEYASIEPLLKRFEEQVRSADIDAKGGEEFLAGIVSGMKERLAIRENVVSGEVEWIDSTVELYEFAIGHITGVDLDRGMVLFGEDDAMAPQFDALMNTALERQRTYLDLVAEFNKDQKSALEGYGLSTKDVGKADDE